MSALNIILHNRTSPDSLVQDCSLSQERKTDDIASCSGNLACTGNNPSYYFAGSFLSSLFCFSACAPSLSRSPEEREREIESQGPLNNAAAVNH